MTQVPERCRECDGTTLRWYVDGRSALSGSASNAPSISGYLACEECSETLFIIGQTGVEALMNGEALT